MTRILLLNEAELREQVLLDEDAIRCVEDAFATLARGQVVMPPILRLDVREHHGEVDVKTAFVPGLDHFAIKISPGFFDNPKIGLPSVNGLMVVFNARTGLVEALLLDNGYLTDIRTAAAGAVAARHLAPAGATTAGIIGAGMQARYQLKALTLVRPIERALLWAREEGKARQAAAELSRELGIPVSVASSAEEAVRRGEIIATATPSEEPLVRWDWLGPGKHITAMGSDAEQKNELEPLIPARADLFVCDRQSQCAALGELHHALAGGLVAEDATFPELGQIVAGDHPGRTSEAQITVCDLTGTGLQDTAIATMALARCLQAEAGAAFQT